ncbi:MAG TPA: ABC transporter permease [Patescibacteria group bacterium]|nr:ABC transporter permease [Patescibacteria group bacterium]
MGFLFTSQRYARLAATGIRRNPLRSGLTCLAVALAVGLFLGAMGLHDGYAAALSNSVDRMGYHVLVTAKGCPYETATLVLRGGNIPMYVDESLVEILHADPAYESGTRFLMQGVENGDNNTFTVFIGIDDQFTKLKPWMKLQQGAWFSGPEAAEAILGYNAAEFLRKKTGDTIPVTHYGRTLVVRGVFDRTGSQDDGMIFLPLAFTQKLFERQGKLTGIGVRLNDITKMGPFLDRAFEIPSMQAITVSQFRGTILDLLGTARALMLIGTLVGVIIAALGVFNSVLVSVTERSQELGVLKVLGASPSQVFAVVTVETLLLGLIGGLTGVALAVAVGAVSDGFVGRLLPYAPVPASGHLIAVDAAHAAAGVAGALVVSVMAGMIPALRASLIPAVRSLRGGRAW